MVKFRQPGLVANRKRNIENLVNKETVEVSVLGEFTINPTLITRKTSDITGVSRTTAQKILKLDKWQSYKIQILIHRGLQFCETMP